MITFIKQYWRSGFIFCLIFYVSTMRIPDMPHVPTFTNEDKLVHILMYFTLTAAIYRDIMKAQVKMQKYVFILIVLTFPITYGGIIEILQGAFFPPRTADWFDFFADAIGSSFAFLLMPKILKLKKRIIS